MGIWVIRAVAYSAMAEHHLHPPHVGQHRLIYLVNNLFHPNRRYRQGYAAAKRSVLLVKAFGKRKMIGVPDKLTLLAQHDLAPMLRLGFVQVVWQGGGPDISAQ